jgi:hypothetical protein
VFAWDLREEVPNKSTSGFEDSLHIYLSTVGVLCTNFMYQSQAYMHARLLLQIEELEDDIGTMKAIFHEQLEEAMKQLSFAMQAAKDDHG